MKGGIQSAKNARKEPNIKQEIQDSLQNNDKRLMEFLERKKILEEK
jgi:DNA topoisomerase VI subunit B